jgi:hypothetical protein
MRHHVARAASALLFLAMLSLASLKSQGCQKTPDKPAAQEPASTSVEQMSPDAETDTTPDSAPDAFDPPTIIPATKSGMPMRPPPQAPKKAPDGPEEIKVIPPTKSFQPFPQ